MANNTKPATSAASRPNTTSKRGKPIPYKLTGKTPPTSGGKRNN